MNDIERLAIAIKESRHSRDAKVHSPDLPVQPIAAQVLQSVTVENRSAINGDIDASNDTLLQDLATDFGLARRLSDKSKHPVNSQHPIDTSDVRLSDESTRSELTQNKSASQIVSNDGRFINIPIEQLTAAGFLTPATKRGLMTEQFRRIKRPLLKNLYRSDLAGESKNVIMVTSSVSGEGKTFTSINLAMSLAMEREKTVLLIDADVLKNTASGVLGIEKGAAGLTDILVGDVGDPADVILKTNIPNFTYLPSGRPQQDANELLSSARMTELFDELSNRYHDRIIVLDCPPILQTNEATVITDYAGQVVFVVAEEETSQSYVVEALSQIPKEIYVGIVLNKSHKRLLGSDYGYTYEYG